MQNSFQIKREKWEKQHEKEKKSIFEELHKSNKSNKNDYKIEKNRDCQCIDVSHMYFIYLVLERNYIYKNSRVCKDLLMK